LQRLQALLSQAGALAGCALPARGRFPWRWAKPRPDQMPAGCVGLTPSILD
jgi:hypothetical protein